MTRGDSRTFRADGSGTRFIDRLESMTSPLFRGNWGDILEPKSPSWDIIGTMKLRERKRDAILASAAELFLESGYSGVTVDAVIAKAGGSKRTLYSYFGDKDGLFSEIVRCLCAEIVTPLTKLNLRGMPLREALELIACTFYDVVLAPRTLALHRLVVAEATRAPESARTFFAAAPATSYRCLEEYFKWAEDAGLVTPGNAYRRSAIFLDALTADFQLRCLLGIMETPTQEERQSLTNETVNIFMKGIAVDAG